MFVHCKAGIGRTGSMVSCWRVSRGMEVDDALALESLNCDFGSRAGGVRARVRRSPRAQERGLGTRRMIRARRWRTSGGARRPGPVRRRRRRARRRAEAESSSPAERFGDGDAERAPGQGTLVPTIRQRLLRRMMARDRTQATSRRLISSMTAPGSFYERRVPRGRKPGDVSSTRVPGELGCRGHRRRRTKAEVSAIGEHSSLDAARTCTSSAPTSCARARRWSSAC